MADFEDFSWCYECGGYEDEYYIDANGELNSECADCPFNCVEDDDE